MKAETAANDRKADRALCVLKAQAMWKGFDKNERMCVRFGMFPADKMQAATADGYDGKDLAVSLMDCATNDGGMRA